MTQAIEPGPDAENDHLVFIYRDDIGRVIAVVFCNGPDDFRVGTLGLPRTLALDRRYPTMAAARQATETWAGQVFPLFMPPPDDSGDAVLN